MRTTDSIISVTGVGYRYKNLLEVLSIRTVKDLLYYFPTYYKDSSNVGTLDTLDKVQRKTVTATLISLKNIRLRNGKFIQKGVLSDGENELEVMWFNQPYLTKTLIPPMNLLLSGKLNPKLTKPQLISPDFEIIREDSTEHLHMGRIVPVYKLTKGISPKWLRTKIKYIVENIDLIEDLEDSLLKSIRDRYNLLDLDEALRLVHFPDSPEDIINARKRLGFDELLAIQHKLMERKLKAKSASAKSIRINNESIHDFVSKLPFTLTLSQKEAVEEIHNDLKRPAPMRRLLQGDVGSGKTIVALLAILPVLEQGMQAALIAPTGILAQQHFESISKLLGKKFKIGLITSETVKSASVDNQLLIGTHAILVNKEKFIKNLALLVIDEQHRFGVEQRRELLTIKASGFVPHLLQLTATPIPRSIALTLFGDYEVSQIFPPQQRKVVKTYIVPENKRKDSISWINNILNDGGQAFWIYPAIEESELIKTKSLEEFYPQLCKTFSNYKLAKIHGKIKATAKDSIINKFAKKKLDIVVATTVVEVGIDIPGANLIIIEAAERFGLAQLHQLRGRVGRKDQQAWCLLYYNESNSQVKNRLEFFAQEHNGIKIAEYDLNRRGPGEVYGTMQSGLPNLRIARFSNLEQLKQVQEAAQILYKFRQ